FSFSSSRATSGYSPISRSGSSTGLECPSRPRDERYFCFDEARRSNPMIYSGLSNLVGFSKLSVLGRVRRPMLMLAALMLATLPAASAQPGAAQPSPGAGSEATLFQNVLIFDGKSSTLSAASTVLVRGNTIERISTSPIAADAGTRVIDGGGRTLMPGLIDAHWHAMMIRPTPAQAIAGDVGYDNIAPGAQS